MRKNKLHFFFVAPRYHPNQIPIVEKLKENGNKVTFYVITEEGSEDHSLIKPRHIKDSILSKLFVKSINAKRKYLIPSFYYLFREFKNNKPDVCIIRNPHYFYGFFFTLFSYIFNVKILLYTQDELYLKNERLRHRFYLLLIKLFNAKWITPILGNKKDGRKICNEIYHLPLPVNINTSEKHIRQDDKIKILMVGKFVSWKRHDLFIKAIHEIRKKNPNVLATIVGECTTDEHKKIFKFVSELIKKNEIININIEINIEHKELLKMYKNYDLFILPSSGERFSISPLEALSCGLPVIISSENGFMYYIEEGIIGYVFNSGSLEDLINKIECCLNGKKYVLMGVQALAFAKKYFSKSTYYNKLNEILNNWK